jgi:hypothetical protein
MGRSYTMTTTAEQRQAFMLAEPLLTIVMVALIAL